MSARKVHRGEFIRREDIRQYRLEAVCGQFAPVERKTVSGEVDCARCLRALKARRARK